MSCNMIVFIKQVPDTKNITGNAMKADGTVNRSALPSIFNPEDLNALELALSLKELYDGKVTVVTMGPGKAANILREALYRGADDAILLSDMVFAGADTLATSFALSCAARKLGGFDLILCGRQAIDGDTAQVGPQIAEKLGIPQLTYVESVLAYEDGKIRVKRAIDSGYEILESPTPVLMTVTNANEPRPANVYRFLKYKKAKVSSEITSSDEKEKLKKRNLLIQEWKAKDCVKEEHFSRLGFSGSPTNVKEICNIVLTTDSHEKFEPTKEGIGSLVKKLINDHTLG